VTIMAAVSTMSTLRHRPIQMTEMTATPNVASKDGPKRRQGRRASAPGPGGSKHATSSEDIALVPPGGQPTRSEGEAVTMLWWLASWLFGWLPSISVPLTGGIVIGLREGNKLISSAQVREKGLKIVQYALKLWIYCFPLDPLAPSLGVCAKNVSIARRFFKYGRWLKHFEDVKEAKKQKQLWMRALLYFEFWFNLGADLAEDLCSLERIGLLPKGTLGVEILLWAEYFQLILALVEVVITYIKVQRQRAKLQKTEVDACGREGRKMDLVRLELLKFVFDIGKAVYDCQFQWSHEGFFIICGFCSAVISTHKNMVKVLAPDLVPLFMTSFTTSFANASPVRC